jgi:AbrB family looped-hinge helix DNA binding protein
MSIAIISEKGQITLPVKARRQLGIHPKDRVSIETRGNEIVIRAAVDFFSLAGFAGTAASPEEEQAAVAEHLKTRHRRARK